MSEIDNILKQSFSHKNSIPESSIQTETNENQNKKFPKLIVLTYPIVTGVVIWPDVTPISTNAFSFSTTS